MESDDANGHPREISNRPSFGAFTGQEIHMKLRRNTRHRPLASEPEAPNNDARILIPIGIAAALFLLLWGLWNELGNRHAAITGPAMATALTGVRP